MSTRSAEAPGEGTARLELVERRPARHGHRPPGREPLADAIRLTTLFLLVAAPLAFGAVHEPASHSLLAVSLLLGLASWARGHWARANGEEVPKVPGRRWLLAFALLAAFQLLPLPPLLLRLVSPGSFSFYNDTQLVPLAAWRPVSASPPDTLRGLLFLLGMVALCSVSFRDFHARRWRLRLVRTLVAVGVVVTVVALVQAASGVRRIYGLWEPTTDYAVFGPYVNANHFAGYVAMVVSLAVALVGEAGRELRRAWLARRAHWLALGDPEGGRLVRRAAAAVTVLVGLLASGSRGGILAVAVGLTVLAWAWSRRHAAAGVLAAIGVVLAASLVWLEPDHLTRAFETRGLGGDRLRLWMDVVRMFPDHPLLGVGFNAFSTAYPPRQHVHPDLWFGEVHNEYLQVLLETGIAGAALALAAFGVLLVSCVRRSGRSTLDAGVVGAVAASCANALVDFNWQIPANAATFAVLAGLALQATGHEEAEAAPGAAGFPSLTPSGGDA